MQDYNRAVLVGSTTFGKATGQVVLPVDTLFSFNEVLMGYSLNRPADMGYLKITTEGFYRVTDATHQRKGVSADVNLLEPYFYDDYKESAMPYALFNDSISKKVVYSPLPPLPIAELKKKSEERIGANEKFRKLAAINDSLKVVSAKETSLPLNPASFKKFQQNDTRVQDEMEKYLYDSSKVYQVQNHLYDKKVINFDEFTKEINERSLKTISEDIYIEEAYSVLKDLIIFSKN
jgi:carboxyl-terminal processing protease